MPKFESAPSLNSPELNPNEMGTDINAGKKLEGELSPEGLEKLKAEEGQEQEVEKPELLPEEQLKNSEQEALEKQKEELIRQQEKERLIREEKEKILQEKLDELFKEFEALNPRNFESIFKSGKTPEGRNVESKSMGSLDPEVAKSLAKAFKEGIKLLPKILEALPELLKKFDEDLTEEATERVEQKLEEEKQKMEEKQKVPEGEIPPGEIKQDTNSIEGENIETPKA